MAEKTFTEALNNLQDAANDIGKQATTLEESIKLFEEGIENANYCKKILDDAEQKIITYTKDSENA